MRGEKRMGGGERERKIFKGKGGGEEGAGMKGDEREKRDQQRQKRRIERRQRTLNPNEKGDKEIRER